MLIHIHAIASLRFPAQLVPTGNHKPSQAKVFPLQAKLQQARLNPPSNLKND